MKNLSLYSVKKIIPVFKKILTPKIFFPVVVLITIIAIVLGVYFFNQYQKAQKLIKNPSSANVLEVEELVKKVGSLIELPNETPALATVSDVTKLKDQPFFVKSQNGDKVLIYTNSKKAIIYRPSTNKIIEVSSINLNNSDLSTPNTSPAPTKTNRVKIVLYNGTTIVGFTKKIEADLKAKFESVEVTGRENASKSDYVKTIVVDVNKNPEIASALAKELSGEVGNLPSGEEQPKEAEILIILGSSSE